MGLIGGLLTLPLAPVRGLAWVFEQVVDEAEAQLHDPRRIRAELADAEAALERGEIDEDTYEALERELLARLNG
jgi:Gas vesicle protein G